MKVPASFAAAIGTFTSPRNFVENASAQVTVREDAGVYTVNATMAGSQPAVVAIIVLSDYDQIARFIPDVHGQPRDRAGTIVAAETQLDTSDVGPAFAVRSGHAHWRLDRRRRRPWPQRRDPSSREIRCQSRGRDDRS